MVKELKNLVETFAKEYNIDISTVAQIFEESIKVAAARYYPPHYAQSLKYVKETGEILDSNNIAVDITKKFGLGGIKLLKNHFLNSLRNVSISKEIENLLNSKSKLIVGRVTGKNENKVFLSYKSLEVILPKEEQIFTEEYNLNRLYKIVIIKIEQYKNHYEIIVSRKANQLLEELLKLEIPELSDNRIKIVSLVREPGYRSKVVVQALDKGIDLMSVCIGVRNARIANVSRELNGERIDIIEYKEDIKEFICSLLKPAQVKRVQLLNKDRIAIVEVPDNEIGVCLGKNGANVRLASVLSGWYIEVKKYA
ncbi:MAG: hypothetical protein ACK4NF_07415 [Planctomycetota bacterium]